MTEKKPSCMQIVSRGLVIENPVLRLALGTCPTLAVSTSLQSALGMGMAATLVLICSNIVISALRKVIPNQVRIPAFITIIAAFVTIVQMLVKAFFPDIDAQLGVYLPLIVVNCIILGRAEAFAAKNAIALSALDGLGMGIGFTAALALMGIIREFFGAGSFFNMPLWPESIPPIVIFILPPGGFFVYGILVAWANKLATRFGMAPMELNCCAGCTHLGTCAIPKAKNAETKPTPMKSSAKEARTPSPNLSESKVDPKAKAHTEATPHQTDLKKVPSTADEAISSTVSSAPSQDAATLEALDRLQNDEFKGATLMDLPETQVPASSYNTPELSSDECASVESEAQS